MFSKKYLEKNGLTEVQAIQLELMKRASFNSFDGERVVRDLLNHRDLWKSCFMTRDIEASIRHHLPPVAVHESSDLIPLRDIDEGYWNVDTLYVLVNKSKEKDMKILALEAWQADDVGVLNKEDASRRLGRYPASGRVICVWWD